MRNIYLTIFALSFFTCYPQDSTEITLRAEPPELIEKTPTMNELIQRRNDSLERELLYYRAKEDYFTAALSDQSGRFTLIVTGLLGLVAFVSYRGFRWEVRRIHKEAENKINEISSSVEEYERRFQNLEFYSQRSTANLFVTIASNFSKDIPVHQLMYRLKAALHHGKAYEIESTEGFNASPFSRKDYGAALANMEKAEKLTEVIIANDGQKKDLKEEWKILKRDLDAIIELPNESLKDVAIKIRYQLKDFLGKQKAPKNSALPSKN